MTIQTDVSKIVQKLNIIGENFPKTVAVGVYALGTEIIRRAARLVPVDTGRLRASSFAVPPESTGTSYKVLIGYAVEYALYVHEGTSRMASRQWLLQTINSFSVSEALGIIESVVDRAAKGEFKRVPSVRSGGVPTKPGRGNG